MTPRTTMIPIRVISLSEQGHSNSVKRNKVFARHFCSVVALSSGTINKPYIVLLQSCLNCLLFFACKGGYRFITLYCKPSQTNLNKSLPNPDICQVIKSDNSQKDVSCKYPLGFCKLKLLQLLIKCCIICFLSDKVKNKKQRQLLRLNSKIYYYCSKMCKERGKNI